MVPQRLPQYPPYSPSSSPFRLPPISLGPDPDPLFGSSSSSYRGDDLFSSSLPPLPPISSIRPQRSLSSLGRVNLPPFSSLPPLPPFPSTPYRRDPLFQPSPSSSSSIFDLPLREGSSFTPSSSALRLPPINSRPRTIDCRCKVNYSAPSSELLQCHSCGSYSHFICLSESERTLYPYSCHSCVRRPPTLRHRSTFNNLSSVPSFPNTLFSTPTPSTSASGSSSGRKASTLFSSSPSPPSSQSSGEFTEGGYDSNAVPGTGRGGLPEEERVFKDAAEFVKFARNKFSSRPAGAVAERKNGRSFVYLYCRNRRKKDGARTGTNCQWEMSAKQIRDSTGLVAYRLFSDNPIHNHECLQRIGQNTYAARSSTTATSRTKRRLRSRAPSPLPPFSSLGISSRTPTASTAARRPSPSHVTSGLSYLDEPTRTAIDGLNMLSFPTLFDSTPEETPSPRRNRTKYSGWSAERNAFE